MSQSDYVVSNGTGAAVRSDINGQLAAIVTQNSGATEPTTTYAYMRWADTTAGVMKMRNGANSAWITLYQLDGEWSTIAFENGTAAAPSIYFKDSGTDTGFYSPGANQVGISTGGTAALVIDSSQRVGLGTSTPGTLLHLQSSDRSVFRVTTSDAGTSNQILFNNGSNYHYGVVGTVSGTSGVTGDVYGLGYTASASADFTPVLSWTADTARVGIGTTSPSSTLSLGGNMDFKQSSNLTTTTGYLNISPSSSLILDSQNGTISFRIGSTDKATLDGSGRFLVGTSNFRTVEPYGLGTDGQNANTFESVGDTNPGPGLALCSNSTTARMGPYLYFCRSGAATVGSNTIVASGDNLGTISFAGADGTDVRTRGAAIYCEVDGTPGANDMPGRLVFSTTADGASSPTERMRIGQSGFTKISNSATYNDTAGTYHELVTTLTGSNNVLFRAPASYGSDNIKSFVLTAAGTGFNHFLADSNGATVCVIRGNGNLGNTNNVYTSLSDSKLKENIIDAGSQWSDIKSLQVRKYNFKEDTAYETHTQIGLVAQEVELVSPGLVEEYPDRDADGNDLGTTTKSVKYSVLYMKAVKALQEAMERIEALEAKVAALEGA